MSNAAAPATDGPDRSGSPLHVAIIMDGNGRWAASRGLPRVEGHRRGVEALRRVVRAANELGIVYLTIFSFSSENWSRPASEIGDLFGLLRRFIRNDLATLHRDGVRVRVIGERDGLDPDICALLNEAEELTRNNDKLNLVVAFNYGSRAEIAAAARRLAREVAEGKRDANSIDADTLGHYLDAPDIPDPDLIIRTSGEQRLSNFLMWQAAYSELVFVPIHWPDFDKAALEGAIAEYGKRERRFGGLAAKNRLVTEGEAAPAAASEQPSTAANEQASRNLVMRVVAALVLAPVAIALAYLGGVAWSLLVTLAAIGLFAEWLLVTGFGRELRVVMPGAVALLLIGLCLMAGRIDAALDMLVVGAVAVALTSGARRGWAIAGLLYAAAAEIASVVLRLDPVKGFAALMFVLLVVWVTDIGGYFAGRGIGGPKLWVRVSPKKTWAGAAGGFVASLLVAACFAAFEIGTAGSLLALGAVLSVVSQFGDLFESAVKRRFGVKDSSHIIPGHGGLLDRLDGFVAAVIVAAIFGFLRGGADGVGRGLMVW